MAQDRGDRFGESAAARGAAIVTGGTRGIGRAIARGLAEDGMSVALVYRRDERAAEEAGEAITAAGGSALLVKGDVGRREECGRIVDEVVREWGRIDVLVNNAGTFEFSILEEMSEEFLDSMYRTNFKSMVFMIQAVLPYLKRARHGRIVNATSISGRLADVGLIAYGCSKASVDMLTRIASAELAPYNITVNAYAPGIIATDMTREMIEERGGEQVQQIPLGRFGDADDAAHLVRFLCSTGADYITGEIIGVDGGMLKVQNPKRARDGGAG